MVLHIRVWESSTAPEFLLYPGGFALLRGFFMPGKYLPHDSLTRQAIDGYPRTCPANYSGVTCSRHYFSGGLIYMTVLTSVFLYHIKLNDVLICVQVKGKVRA